MILSVETEYSIGEPMSRQMSFKRSANDSKINYVSSIPLNLDSVPPTIAR